MAEVTELSQSAANERAAEVEQPEVPETIELVDAEFAILIYRNRDGSLVVSPDINVPVEVERQASTDELKATLSKILDDIKAQEMAALTAQLVVQQQMAMAMQMQRAKENQQILSQLPPGLAK